MKTHKYTPDKPNEFANDSEICHDEPGQMIEYTILTVDPSKVYISKDDFLAALAEKDDEICGWMEKGLALGEEREKLKVEIARLNALLGEARDCFMKLKLMWLCKEDNDAIVEVLKKIGEKP